MATALPFLFEIDANCFVLELRNKLCDKYGIPQHQIALFNNYKSLKNLFDVLKDCKFNGNNELKLMLSKQIIH